MICWPNSPWISQRNPLETSAEDRGFGGYEDGLAVGPQFQISWKAEKEALAGWVGGIWAQLGKGSGWSPIFTMANQPCDSYPNFFLVNFKHMIPQFSPSHVVVKTMSIFTIHDWEWFQPL